METDLVVLEDEPALDVIWQFSIVVAKASERGFLIAKYTCVIFNIPSTDQRMNFLPPIWIIITLSWSRPILSIISQ